MASDIGFVEYVCEQIRGAGQVSHRRMFGEFAVYCDGKVVALVCDNQFFLKPTDAGKALLDRVKEAPPYPGAKPYFLIDAQLDDAEAAATLVRVTAAALPAPAAKPARKAAKKAPRGRIAGRATRPAK
ncbi:MAG: TfoX/Sxy family protein [Steroidobacteraceae bacterium]|nr:TfoX/Sxy family protein [Pseudomonadota bacterium]MBP7611199.1 TfoX/Sxy family protein [Steroidobacteraceae bacterium]MBP9130034.1 TfoX/Sxy family protein [Steroidobacteraceae bacterium]